LGYKILFYFRVQTYLFILTYTIAILKKTKKSVFYR
jgi:hypothetical protein